MPDSLLGAVSSDALRPDHLETTLRLGIALLLGACIGFERQWRQRMAGLRTNVLVALGAASFTLFALLTPGEISPTRVAAQVVSGIGFLGAGVILRTGVNIQGLNTAATLWCAAAVGVFAGSGFLIEAAIATGFIVVTNLVLRPIVRLINRQPFGATEMDHHYRIAVVCRADQEAHIRALLLQGVSVGSLRLRRLHSEDLADSGRVEVTADLNTAERAASALEQIVGRLSLEASVTGASWRVLGEEDLEERDGHRGLLFGR